VCRLCSTSASATLPERYVSVGGGVA
jgi:hypothetical protein